VEDRGPISDFRGSRSQGYGWIYVFIIFLGEVDTLRCRHVMYPSLCLCICVSVSVYLYLYLYLYIFCVFMSVSVCMCLRRVGLGTLLDGWIGEYSGVQ
jgi:hypothetical protein